MAGKWQTVRVFISSTFRDMHTERDHLVRVVFPELKERCLKRYIQLIDVDLRWGVTEEQAEGGGALDICLDEIDSCRPYFLGLLGHRYGYIPPDHVHSITAQEVYHGVLHNNLPRQLIDLRPFVEGILEGRTLFKEQVSCLVRCYQWDPEKRKYLLKQDITPEDQKTLRSIFDVYSIYQKDRSFFFFRSESLTEKLRERSGSEVKDYFETDETFKNKLGALKQEIKNAKLPCFEYDNLETFGQQVLETLWRRIDAEFPEKREEIERDWLKEEAEFHELFMADRTRRFVGRSDILRKMHAFVEEDFDPRLMVVIGEPGCGKSALVARFSEEVINRHPDWLILSHFVGASPSSTSLRRTLRRLCTQLNRVLGVAEEVPEEYKELAHLFPELLQKVSETHRILLVIDALNQFERADNAHTMRWLPQELPQNVKVVVSILAGEALDALKARHIQPQFEELSGLTEPEVKEFVTSYLREVRKDFPTPKIREAFYDKIKAGNPLYVLVALEELRVFPVFEELGRRVASLPDTVPELFGQVLERVEGDFNRLLVQDFMSFIACGQQGMTGEELQTLLKGHSPVIDEDKPPAKLPDMLFSRLQRAFGAYLFERSGVIDFFHGQLKDAVGKRYLTEEADRDKTHQIIAEYFEKRWAEPYLRALDELPHQLTKAKDWDGLERVLCDLRLIEAKCAAGMTYDLVADYTTALDTLPEAQEEKQKERKHQKRVKKYTEDLIAYAKGEIDHLDIIPSVEPWSGEKIKQETEQLIKNPTRLDRIRAFSQFVSLESDGLANFGVLRDYCLQAAYNSAYSGLVVNAAESVVNNETDIILLLHLPSRRPTYFPHPALVRTLVGHDTKGFSSVCITTDGKVAVSGSYDNLVRVWNLETGECLKTLEGHTSWIECIGITPDGKKAVSASNDDTLRVWNIETGECLYILQGHKRGLSGVSITPDGRLAVSGSSGNDASLRIWDLNTGIISKTINGYNGEGVKITPDGKMAVVPTLRVWDLETGSYRLKGYPRWIYCLDITPDGEIAITGDKDGLIQLWDLTNGNCLNTFSRQLERENNWLKCVSITPDKKLAVSASRDKKIRLWDVKSGKCLKTFEGHTDDIESLSITPDGRIAVSGSRDETLRIWDLQKGQNIDTSGYDDLDSDILRVTCDGKKVISGGRNDPFRVWELETGKCLKSVKNSDCVWTLNINPEGSIAIASYNDVIKVLDLKRGEIIGTIKEKLYAIGDQSITQDGRLAIFGKSVNFVGVLDINGGKSLKQFKTYYPSLIWRIAISRDGKSAVIIDRYGIWLWDLESGQYIKTINGHSNSFFSLSITSNGERAVTSGDDNTIQVWDMNTGLSQFTLATNARVFDAVITPDGKRIITGKEDGTVQIWDLGAKTSNFILYGHANGVNSVSITPDGTLAVSGSVDGTIRVWNLENKKCIKVFSGHTGGVNDVIITSSGQKVISCSSDTTVRIWDIETGRCLFILKGHSETITNIDITSDENRIISASADKTLRLWDLNIGQCLKIFEGHYDTLTCVSITPDGKRMVSGGLNEVLLWDIETQECLKIVWRYGSEIHSLDVTPDGEIAVSGNIHTINLWDIKKGEIIRTLNGHRYEVKGIIVTPDGKQAVSCGYDKTIRLWDLRTGKCIKTMLGHTDYIESICITPDGKMALSGGRDKTIRVWNLEEEKCVAIYQADSKVRTISKMNTRGFFAIKTQMNRVIFIRAKNLSINNITVTPVRMWIPRMRKTAVFKTKSPLGYWDVNVTSVCPWCGQRFPVSDKILDVIRAINRDAGLTPDQSPCLELPDEAWEEPQLLSECPLCHKPLKFNPFIVDNRGKY